MDHVPALAVFALGGMCGATFIGGCALWMARRMTHYVATTSALAMDSASELARIRGFAQAQRAELDAGRRCPGHEDWDALTRHIAGPGMTRPATAELH